MAGFLRAAESVAVSVIVAGHLYAQADSSCQGMYFEKKAYTKEPLPGFVSTRGKLPSPVFAPAPEWVETYWKAWELAFANFQEPRTGAGFVSQFIDASFNENIFLWDTAFMTMFCNVAFPLVPGIASLDNFYCKQHRSGEICREIRRDNGVDFGPWQNREHRSLFSRWGFNNELGFKETAIPYLGRSIPDPPPALTLDALDNPVAAWAEVESYRMTGDTGRLSLVWRPLQEYYRALQKYLRQGNGLYVTDWASMDNAPRNRYLESGGTGVDISSQMVLFARDLAWIGRAIGKDGEADLLVQEADSLSAVINRLMWDDSLEFYVDLTPDGRHVPVRSIAAFWTLIAGVATRERAGVLVRELQNPARFWRTHPVPCCPADEPGYLATGGYWRGGVWAPTNTMVIRGLEKYGYEGLARQIALTHVGIVSEVFAATGSIWEHYAPDTKEPGRMTDGRLVQKDFVGWSGIGPILYFLEYGVGLRPDASSSTLVWNLNVSGETGCLRYRFGGRVVDLLSKPNSAAGGSEVTVRLSGTPFVLIVRTTTALERFVVRSGESVFRVRE